MNDERPWLKLSEFISTVVIALGVLITIFTLCVVATIQSGSEAVLEVVQKEADVLRAEISELREELKHHHARLKAHDDVW